MTIDQAMQVAVQHHQAGRLGEAEAIYRQVLAVAPEHVDALHLLGVLAGQVGRADVAVELIGKAVRVNPGYAEAWSNLGDALRHAGRIEEAIAACRRAVELKPGYAEAHNNLGLALSERKDYAEAIASYERAIQLNAGLFEAHNNLGIALMRKGRLEEAAAACRRAIELQPNVAEAHSNLGNALKDLGRHEEAIAAYRKAIELRPTLAEAWNNLGFVLGEKGEFDEALAACQRAIELQPTFAEGWYTLGLVLAEQGRQDDALAAQRRAVELRPDFEVAHNSVGTALVAKGELGEAEASFRRAIELAPEYGDPEANLGNVLALTGRHEEAAAAYGRAMALQPANAAYHSNLVYGMNFREGLDAEAIRRECAAWNERHCGPLRGERRAHDNSRSPERKLRVGYVSPDFRDHVVGRNVVPLLTNHDRERFEIYAYYNNLAVDGVTERIRGCVKEWREIAGLTDAQAAERIREDRIDILVDLTLHMANGRLLIFARKPAPVQVSFAGYPGSTGVETIDYRLTDGYLEPEEASDEATKRRSDEGEEGRRGGETAVRLPHSFWCYDPLDCGDIAVGPLPAESKGFVTFGCLNNFLKVNEGVLRLWAKVMRQVAGSRLLLLADEGPHRERTRGLLAEAGIDPARLQFVGKQPRRQYMATYNRIDVGLDSFPYNGHTTSLDSYWMGVPVVTLVGQTPVARAGWSQLSNLGLTELAAFTPERFVEVAVELAKDLPRLAEMRRALRSRMEKSPLMDAVGFTRGIEAAYRTMWKAWCRA